MNEVLITAIGGILTTIIGSWLSWFFTRKKYNTEVDSNQIKNMQESLEFYKQLSDDNKLRLEEVLQKNKELEKEVAELRQQVFELMHATMMQDKKKLKKMEKENKSLKKKAKIEKK